MPRPAPSRPRRNRDLRPLRDSAEGREKKRRGGGSPAAASEPSSPEPRPPAPAAQRTAQPIEPLAAPVAPSLPAAPAPERVATPEPALTAEPSTPTRGFLEWLTNLLEAFLRFCGRLFGAVEPSQGLTSVETEPIPQPHKQEARFEAASGHPAPFNGATAGARRAADGGGHRSTVMVSERRLSEESPVEIGVGIPSWSMKDDPSSEDAEVSIETLGTPSWSMKDDPSDSSRSRNQAQPKRRAKAVPATSRARVERPIAQNRRSSKQLSYLRSHSSPSRSLSQS